MRECAMCGAAIPETRRSNNTKYCSLKCARDAETRSRIHVIAKRARNHGGIALYVYAAYNHKCALCDWQASAETISYRGKIQYAHGNEIHHIIPVSEGGSDLWDNVILLCPNHHKQADMGILSREYLREHTRPYGMTEEEKLRAKCEIADMIGALIT